MPLLGQIYNDHFVTYPDGKQSECMDKNTAKRYARIFGGKVHKSISATVRNRGYCHFWGIEFEPRDLWIGVYFKKPFYEMGFKVRRFYLCIIPMLPITLTVYTKAAED